MDPNTTAVVLRDGTSAVLRLTEPSDHDAVRRFFHELSPESRQRRFFTLAEPLEAFVDAFCDSGNLRRQATLVALSADESAARPIAIGSYLEVKPGIAEAAFAVDDAHQGRGLGTILLEQLAAMAAANGFAAFEAIVLPDNSAMLEVFRDSGFAIHSTSERGAVTVRFPLGPTAASLAAAARRHPA